MRPNPSLSLFDNNELTIMEPALELHVVAFLSSAEDTLKRVVHLVGPSDQVKVEDIGTTVTFWQPLNPWARATLDKVKTFG